MPRSAWRRSSKGQRTYAVTASRQLQGMLEDSLRELYADCWKDINRTAGEYFKKLEERDAEMRAQLEAGLITDERYYQWRITQLGRGERWLAMRDQMAQRMTRADREAAAFINDRAADMYALNYNYTAYTIEALGAEGVDFTLVSEHTLRELTAANHVNFRTLRVDPVRDYTWNASQIQRLLTESIVKGDAVDQMAASFLTVMRRNETAAVRNARTAMTSARNAGTQAAMEQGEEMGIEALKEWIAADDDRTRESHAELDGVRVGIDELFPNGLEYPGDPAGEPAEVYNCRCTMRSVFPGFESAQARTDHTRESYEAWRAQKGG